MNDSVNSEIAAVSAADVSLEMIQLQLCTAFNSTPFVSHHGLMMRIVDGEIQAYLEMQPILIGNQAFKILHGGVAATMLDSLAGVCGVIEIYRRGMMRDSKYSEDIVQLTKKATRIATIDMRIDYVAPGRGQYFVGTAQVVRFGRKGCTIRADMHNDVGVLIATAMIAFAF